MDIKDVSNLLDYHYWSRDRILDSADKLSSEQFTRDLRNSFPSVRDTLAHTYGAEWIWFSRWQGTSPTSGISPDLFPDVVTLRSTWAEQEQKVRDFFAQLAPADLSRSIRYRLLNGTEGESQLGEMLQHMVNHASYHRGQVTTMLRQLGAAPPKSMDMIAFFRERDAAAHDATIAR